MLAFRLSRLDLMKCWFGGYKLVGRLHWLSSISRLLRDLSQPFSYLEIFTSACSVPNPLDGNGKVSLELLCLQLQDSPFISLCSLYE